MKFAVNDNCIGCGLCAATCPVIFEMSSEGVAHVTVEDVPEEYLGVAEEAQDGCPVGAIESEE